MNCQAFRRALYHFQADELGAEERREAQVHLDSCPGCAERLEFEEGMLRGVRARLAAEEPPPGLETRVRARLAERREATLGGGGWLRSPWFAVVATSVLLAALLVPWGPRGERSGAHPVQREVILVDRPCDEMGAPYDAQRRCRDPRHLNALRLSPGEYWSLSVDGEAGVAMATDPELRGRRLRVLGVLYPEIHTVQVEGYEDLGPAEAEIALLRPR